MLCSAHRGDDKNVTLMSIKEDDNIIAGAVLVTTATMMIVAMGSFAKWLGETYHPIELVFYRNLLVLVFMSVVFTATQKWSTVKTQRLPSHIGRALVGTIGIGLGFWSVSLLPLADFTTISFTTPLFVVLLSYPLLKEHVGPWRYGAVVIGFLGVILVAKPSGDELPILGVTVGLAAAFTTALVQIYLRDLGRTESTMTTVFHFMFWGTVSTAVCLPFVWTGPKWADMIFIIGLALAGGAQQFLKTKGFAMGPVALMTPLTYTSLIWAIIIGIIVWQDFPDRQVIAGATIIIASNLFILWREQVKGKTWQIPKS